MKIVAMSQSNYIPWKGFFDLIHDADIFVYYDEVQYTSKDWRNRNLIKTAGGARWLSIPVATKGKFHQKISETKVSDKDWAKRHWNTIYENYHKSRYYKNYSKLLEETYFKCSQMDYLCNINYCFINVINNVLNIKTEILNSKNFDLADGKAERVVKACKDCGATTYLCGPAAKSYLSDEMFERHGIRLRWKDYSGYPEYWQRTPPFTHNVSVLDLIFNAGPKAPYYIWGWREKGMGIR